MVSQKFYAKIFVNFWSWVFTSQISTKQQRQSTETKHVQEGWLSIANGTCISFCNQPKAHFGLPWIRPWDNRGKCYMDGKRMLVKRLAAYTHLSSTISEI